MTGTAGDPQRIFGNGRGRSSKMAANVLSQHQPLPFSRWTKNECCLLGSWSAKLSWKQQHFLDIYKKAGVKKKKKKQNTNTNTPTTSRKQQIWDITVNVVFVQPMRRRRWVWKKMWKRKRGGRTPGVVLQRHAIIPYSWSKWLTQVLKWRAWA